MSQLQEGERNPQFSDEKRRRFYEELKELAQEAEAAVISGDVYASDPLEGTTVDNLMGLALEMLHQPSSLDAYGRLAQTPPEGRRTYYELLIGRHQLEPAYEAAHIGIYLDEPMRVERGLDIATGVGTGAIKLSEKVEHLVAIDASAPLLRVAKERLTTVHGAHNPLAAQSFETRLMDALHMTFSAQERFDIALSIGFTHLLTTEERREYYAGVREVLKAGGRYYEPRPSLPLPLLIPSRKLLAIRISGIPAFLNGERFDEAPHDPDFASLGLKKTMTTFSPSVLKLIKE